MLGLGWVATINKMAPQKMSGRGKPHCKNDI